MRHNLGLVLLMIVGAILSGAMAYAEDDAPFEFHGRIGSIEAAYAGPQIGSGTFNLPNGLDLEIDYFVNQRRSYLLRTVIGIDQKASSNRYSYTGLGERFYFLSRGLVEEYSTPELTLKTVPKWRFFWGVDLGLSQVLVVQLNPLLGTYASLIEGSGCVGSIYQVTTDIGLEAHLDYGMGVGYTNVSATMTVMRAFLGLDIFL